MPFKRPDMDSIVYQHGFFVGMKAQYAGVSIRLTLLLEKSLCRPLRSYFLVTFLYLLEKGGEVFYQQSLDIHRKVS